MAHSVLRPTVVEFIDIVSKHAEMEELELQELLVPENASIAGATIGESDIRLFESVAGDVLEALGYDCLYAPPGEKAIYSQEEIRQSEAENLRLKEAVRQRARGDDLERRDRQVSLIQEIRNRGQMSPPSMRAIA